jgi:hypothetical protein
MFLTAVLQGHTDSVANSQTAPTAPAANDADVALPEGLEKALTLPVQERLQPLPAAHRSRWV